MYTQSIKKVEEFLILITQSENISRCDIENNTRTQAHDNRTSNNYQQNRGNRNKSTHARFTNRHERQTPISNCEED